MISICSRTLLTGLLLVVVSTAGLARAAEDLSTPRLRARAGALGPSLIVPGAIAGGIGLTLATRLAGTEHSLGDTAAILPAVGFSVLAAGILVTLDGHAAGRQLTGLTTEPVPRSYLAVSGSCALAGGVFMLTVVTPLSTLLPTADESSAIAVPILTGAGYMAGGLAMLVAGLVHENAPAMASAARPRRNFLAFSPVFDPNNDTFGVALKGTF
jgi:hypothetical protein